MMLNIKCDLPTHFQKTKKDPRMKVNETKSRRMKVSDKVSYVGLLLEEITRRGVECKSVQRQETQRRCKLEEESWLQKTMLEKRPKSWRCQETKLKVCSKSPSSEGCSEWFTSENQDSDLKKFMNGDA